MLKQYPKLKKLLYYYPLFAIFGVGYFVYIKVHDPSLFEFLVTVSFWISLPITFYTCRFVNNLQIIEKIKYSPKTIHELLYMMLALCQLPLWIAVIWTLITFSEMIAK
jgi:hypothetical protein